VSADIISIARGAGGPVLRAPAQKIAAAKLLPGDSQQSRCYMRLTLQDAPGAIAGVAGVLADHAISIDSLMQPSVGEHPGVDVAASVVITTHYAPVGKVRKAVAEIEARSFCRAKPRLFRIEDFED
jgi:homoserine dehydrogenase